MISITGYGGDIGSMLEPMFASSGFYCKKYDGDLKGVYRILHLAAKSPPASYDEIVASNVIFLGELIKKAEQSGVKELIFFSAASVYGSLDSEAADESAPFQNPGIYGLSKAFGEEILRESKLNVLVVRLPAVLGLKNNTNIIARWYRMLKNNEDVVFKNKDKLFNNFITVESIFDFLKDLTLKEKFDIANLASERTMSISDILFSMKKALSSSSNLIDGGISPSFAIDTGKAEAVYGFIPQNPEEAILSWIQKKEFCEA